MLPDKVFHPLAQIHLHYAETTEAFGALGAPVRGAKYCWATWQVNEAERQDGAYVDMNGILFLEFRRAIGPHASWGGTPRRVTQKG